MKLLLAFLLTAASVSIAQTDTVSIAYGPAGLAGITYNGFQYLAKGQFGVNAVNFADVPAKVSPAELGAAKTDFDAAKAQTTITYGWGMVAVRYTTARNKLTLTITTTNNSPHTIAGLFYEPLDLQFPTPPHEFDGVSPRVDENLGNPTAIRMTAGPNALVLTNEDVLQPLIVGFPWSLNKPANTIFPVRVETSKDPMLPNSIPYINRPIPPGKSEPFTISLRFGPASAPTRSLVSDLYHSFANAYPFTLHWPDRRPIGQLILASTATHFPTNPRGWFNDPNVDTVTPEGVAAFQERVLRWAHDSVVNLKRMNAQGMITWDIEGEEYPQSTTYIGDPQLFPKLAPEMAGVADRYFQTFTKAGFRVGICIRPQHLSIPANGQPPEQTETPDPTAVMAAKIAYANKRWGATLFYIDSNGDPNFPMPSMYFRKLAAQFPNVLLIPEHKSASYLAFGSWYGELRGGVTGTPQSILEIYPQAFSVIYTPDGSLAKNRSALLASFGHGDIPMFRAWYEDPQHQELMTLLSSRIPSSPVK